MPTLRLNQRIVYDLVVANGPISLQDLLARIRTHEHRIDSPMKVINPLVAKGAILFSEGLYSANPLFFNPPTRHNPTFRPKTTTDDEAFKILIYFVRKWKDYLTSLGAVGGPHRGIYEYLLSTATHPLLLSSAGLTPTQYIFKEMAMHAQNSPRANSIRFLNGGEPMVRDLTGNYGLIQTAPIYHLTGAALDDYIIQMTGARKIGHWVGYVKVLNAINNYLYRSSALKTHTDVVHDFLPTAHLPSLVLECEDIARKFKRLIPKGFDMALSLDFLKEFDPSFDYPKPDTHVRKIMFYLYNSVPAYCSTKAALKAINPHMAIELLQSLFEGARRSYVAHGGSRAADFTYYLFDKIIYQLCCDKPLYFPREPFVDMLTARNHKNVFINSLIRCDYLNIDLNNPVELRNAISDIDSCL